MACVRINRENWFLFCKKHNFLRWYEHSQIMSWQTNLWNWTGNESDIELSRLIIALGIMDMECYFFLLLPIHDAKENQTKIRPRPEIGLGKIVSEPVD